MNKERAIQWFRDHAHLSEDERAEALSTYVEAYARGIREGAMSDRRKLQWWSVFSLVVDGLPEQGSALVRRMRLFPIPVNDEELRAIGAATVRAVGDGKGNEIAIGRAIVDLISDLDAPAE